MSRFDIPFLRLWVREPLDIVVLQGLSTLGALDLVPQLAVEVASDGGCHALQTSSGSVFTRFRYGGKGELHRVLGVGADNAVFRFLFSVL